MNIIKFFVAFAAIVATPALPAMPASEDAAPVMEFAFEEIVKLGPASIVGKTGHG